MRSLSFKLILAFLAIGLVGAALAAVFARQATLSNFDNFVLQRSEEQFLKQVTAYYIQNGNWKGINAFMRTADQQALQQPREDSAAEPNLLFQQPQAQQAQTQSTQGEEEPPRVLFALADARGVIVLPGVPYRMGIRVSQEEIKAGTPVTVDGRVVGTILRTGYLPPLDPRDVAYLNRTNRSLIYAGIGAALAALLIGLILTRTLTTPLRNLTRAIRSMAKGNLAQQVEVRTQDEIGELAGAFNQMSTELAHANHLREQMTADIAHDLRTPLTVIGGYLESIQEGVLEPTPERIAMIHAEVQHLERLVEDLRTLSLADAGKLSMNLTDMAPGDILNRAAAVYQDRAQKQGVALEVSVPDDLPIVRVDAERMNQVLSNLVSNALRYTPEGGSVFLRAAQEHGHVVLEVEDTGAGISPKALPNIFERFYRADDSRQREMGETGLGLAIARSIIEMHGGSIYVRSQLGVGTYFKIKLPAAA